MLYISCSVDAVLNLQEHGTTARNKKYKGYISHGTQKRLWRHSLPLGYRHIQPVSFLLHTHFGQSYTSLTVKRLGALFYLPKDLGIWES